MKYLEDAFKFLGKNLLLSIPLIIMVVIPNIIQGSTDKETATEMANQINQLSLSVTMGEISPTEFQIMALDILKPLFVLMAIANVVLIVLSLFITPATYGMVNKALEEEDTNLIDFFPQLGKKIFKFIIFSIASFLLWFIISIVVTIISVLMVFLVNGLSEKSSALMGLGIVISVLLGVVVFLALVAFYFLTIYWFPAMVIDDLRVISAFKKSIEVARSYFWPTVGITTMIFLMGSIISFIIALPFSLIPYVGVVLSSVPTALAQFVTIVFVLMVYRDKTSKNQLQDDGINDTPYELI
ncbi:MAG: hypothetical protein GX383_00235 [Clostridium sp.]|jgi:hypothetical protein|nr:hypothetical protein [Clostridium sp.]